MFHHILLFVFGLFLPFSLCGAEIDITSTGEFCKDQKLTPSAAVIDLLRTNRKPKQQWATPFDFARASVADLQDAQSLWALSHDLNAQYIRSIASSLKARIDLAEHMGVDLSQESNRIADLRTECEMPNPFGQNLAREFGTIAGAFTTHVKAHAPEDIDDYTKMAVMAMLESYRLEHVLVSGLRQLPGKDADALARQLRGVILRLLILRQRFPFLQNLSWVGESGAHLSRSAASLLLFSTYSPAAIEESIYFSSEEYDAIFGYNVLNCQALKAVGELEIRKIYPYPGEYKGRAYFPFVYRRIVEGKLPIPAELRERLKSSLKTRVRQSLDSVELKCNSGPCSTMAVRPEEAAEILDKNGSLERLKPLVCACRIDRETQTVPNWLNYTIGFTGAGLGIGCILSGAGAVICPLALYSIVLDMGIGIAGIFDAEMNDIEVRKWAIGRTDSVPVEEDYETRQRVRKNSFEFDYNYATGLFSFFPYKVSGRTTYRLARVLSALLHDPAVTHVALIESVKAASAIPVPQLRVHSVEAIKKLDRKTCP